MLSKLAGLVLGKEPVMFATLVGAVMGLAVAFGFDLTEEQQAAITAVIVAVGGFLARSVVTPIRKG